MIRRYQCAADTTITNQYLPDLSGSATGSNSGFADTAEIFHIYAQANTSSHELSRTLWKWDTTAIAADRTAGLIPASGSCEFHLRLFNARHSFTVPKAITLSISPVTKSWDEGTGVALEAPFDYGYCNWDIASSGASGIEYWDNVGGDIASGSVYSTTYFCQEGWEDVDKDVSGLVEAWIAGSLTNNGICVYLTGTLENALSSSYTKRIFTNGSEYFYRRPIIECRYNSSLKDRRGSFYASSSLAPDSENLNTLYFYNIVRGQLRNVPYVGSGSIYVNFYTNPDVSGSLLTTTTGSWVSTGIYSCSIALATTASLIYDVWHSGSSYIFWTGSIAVKQLTNAGYYANPELSLSIPGLKPVYSTTETPRFRVKSREKFWQPNIYTVAYNDAEQQIVEDLYYRIVRTVDDLTVVDFGTGSMNHTRLSYDASGSYFDFDMSILEESYLYRLDFCKKKDVEQFELLPTTFKFRVTE